jgi:sulfate adenylyltransferase
MIEEFYPRSKVILGTFATYSRYAGPREALFTALVRKNFGCSHFIVGRDHTGVGNFYGPYDSHKIFDKFEKGDIGIIPVKFDKVFYSDLECKYFHEPDIIDISESDKLHISGTRAREMLKKGERPPEWFMRPEISKIIIDRIRDGKKVFVE